MVSILGWLLLSATALGSTNFLRTSPPLIFVDEFNNEFDTVENNNYLNHG